MKAQIVNASKEEKELLNLVSFKKPVFVEFINNKSEAYRIKSYYGARKDPFVILDLDDELKPFYSEEDNAINQLINYLCH